MKNCPRVECRRVSISMGAIYKAAYGTLSRRVCYSRRGQRQSDALADRYIIETESPMHLKERDSL